jgi:sulfur carrier protein ThiS
MDRIPGWRALARRVAEMVAIFQLDDKTVYAEDEEWRVELEDGSAVALGVVFEAADLAGTEGFEDEEYSVIVEAEILPRPESLDEEVVLEVSEDEDPSRERLIFDLYRHYGGVPVNIDALQPARASCGASAFVADQVVRGQKTASGKPIEVRHFRTVEDALTFTREFYIVMAPIIFEFLDWVLDQPLGDGTGWDKIRSLSKGE